jgi:hypothetical protein
VTRATPETKQDNDLRQASPALAVRLQSEAETDADLQRIVSTWPHLPPHIRAAVLALVEPIPFTGKP